MTDQELLERILEEARRGMTTHHSTALFRLSSAILEWVRRRPELGYQERIKELEAEIERLKRKPEAIKKWMTQEED